jgi:hypothetical protein
MALLKSGTRIYGNAIIDTNLSIDGNTVSSNYQSGALVIAGGAGIGGNVFINGKLNAKDTLITGNLTVTGITTTVNSTTTQIEDAIIDLGAGENGNTLTTDDGVSRGLALNYFSAGAKTAFLGWDNANSQFAFGSNVANTTGVLQINTYGNVKANNFFGTFSGIANLSQATVTGITRLGNVGNVKITGGGPNQYLQTDGQGNLVWVSPQITSPGGSNNQVQFNSNGSFVGSSNFTFNTTGNILTVDYIVANGSSLTDITGANVTGVVANATYATVAGNATIAGTVYTNAQPNITSVGTLSNLSVTGNITSGNISGGNLVSANYFSGNGSLLTSLTGANVTGTVANATYATNAGNAYNVDGSNVTGQVGNALVAGTVYIGSQPNITSVGNLSNLTVGNATSNVVIANGNVTATGNLNITGNISAGYITGNAAYLTGLAGNGSATATYITSNINNIVAGSTITVVADYGNASYPGGVFTIAQLGPVTLSTTDIWYGGTSTKNAYANYLASSVNTKDVNVTLTLSNATFNVQSTDSITIGGSSITGANLLALNINGNGTYTIPNTYFSSSVQTTTTSSVSLSLTTSRGVYTSTGTTLTATQPVAFTLNAITGSFPSSSVPYFSLNQSFNWSASVTGTVSAGNITYSGGSIGTTSLTSSGGTSGSSGSIDSTYSYTLTTSDYTGAGLYGYGTRVIPSTVNGTISAATKYYPVFYKITNSATPPTLTTSDSYLTHNYVTGDGATTSATTSQYTWIAIPGVASHTFAYTFLGSQVGQDPAVTSTQTISGYNYNIYGFTNFSVATFLYTVT